MRASERNGRDGGMDETATGFIDIQFGLIAILILLLSAAVSGIGNLSNQLKGVEGGMAGVINLLLCDWNGDQGDCKSEDRNRFAGHAQSEIEMIRPDEELVLVLGMPDKNWARSTQRLVGLFQTSSNDLPQGTDVLPDPLSTISDRINAILPCFAPFSRNVPDPRRIDLASSAEMRCQRVLDELGAASPGVDLFQIEGHGDWSAAGPTDAGIAVERAQAVLLRLLRTVHAPLPPPNAANRTFLACVNSNAPLTMTHWVNCLSRDALADQLDEIVSLPDEQLDDLTALFWLAPLGARITEECRLGREQRQDLPEWCQGLLPEGQPNSTPNLESRLPKLFAMTSYGRYSLRYGEPGEVHPSDRRVEFRLRGSIIPTAIHDLFTDRDGPYFKNTRLFRLYSTDAVRTLHQCDARREENDSCLNALDLLITSD